MNVITSGSAAEADAARKQLREELLAIAPVFGQKPFFLSDEFSPVDCHRTAAVASANSGVEFSGPARKS